MTIVHMVHIKEENNKNTIKIKTRPFT